MMKVTHSNMKKLFSFLLAAVMLLSLGTFAFADEGDNFEFTHDYEEDGYEFTFPQVGVTMYLPASWLFDCHGSIQVVADEELGYHAGVYLLELDYMAMTADEFEENGYDAEYAAPLLQIICLKPNFDTNAFSKAGVEEPNWDYAMELCQRGDYTFYTIVGSETLPSTFTPEMQGQFISFVSEDAMNVLYSAYYDEPVSPYAESIGSSVQFETEDLDGSPVSSADVFSANEITMVNVWGTWCPHCIEEMPQLAQIHNQLQAVGCGIVGLLDDGDDPDAVEDAKQIIADAGVTFPVLKAPANKDELFPGEGLPKSYFVNRSGEIVGEPISGAAVDLYYEAVTDLLNGNNGGSGSKSDINASKAITKVKDSSPDLSGTEYRIICVDESGNPVSGAKVQFCSDDTCMMGVTDADGIAVFDENPGHYTVHLLKPPAGYAKDGTEYEAPDTWGDVTIVLHAA